GGGGGGGVSSLFRLPLPTSPTSGGGEGGAFPAPKAPLTLATIPAEDPATYAMIRRADTIGVFQVESRAQMAMLPRLRPRRFYDLVIEVAIVRPGPIQGDMVHPYLRRRQGLEPVDYPSEAVREVLERTLGVPIFQEQVIKLAMVAAGFSAGEADGLRRAMAAWRRRGGLAPWRERLLRGMTERGYDRAFAERVYRQILGFGEYGFPESHAASFALLAYASAWLKRHHPAAFCAALLNSQPMGFYQPAQLVRDAREHGVEVRPVDVRRSDWDCTLEPSAADPERPALRLGLRLVRGLSRAGAERLVAARAQGGFADVPDLAGRAALERRDLQALAAADALAGLAGHRHAAAWAVAGVEPQLPLFGQPGRDRERPALAPPSLARSVWADHASQGLSLRAHPLALLREALAARGLLSAREVAQRPPGSLVRTAGLVTIRQRPGGGRAVFVTIEDETGVQNLLVWADLAERQRQVLLGAGLLGVVAEVQRAEGVQHLLCRRLEDHSALLAGLESRSRDFR
ncbi:MAG TPA: error-prone DNA polymerase, partial [Gammaproteobacteria bacterium]|nr:error-prone DNA polymerase [Gammaproteobacteria bacterium]